MPRERSAPTSDHQLRRAPSLPEVRRLLGRFSRDSGTRAASRGRAKAATGSHVAAHAVNETVTQPNGVPGR